MLFFNCIFSIFIPLLEPNHINLHPPFLDDDDNDTHDGGVKGIGLIDDHWQRMRRFSTQCVWI